jgi:hypothetical protein
MRTKTARHARRPPGELRDRRVGNYVIANPSNLGNFLIVDNQKTPPTLQGDVTSEYLRDEVVSAHSCGWAPPEGRSLS